MPLFSIIIPTYNRSERLLRALRSVFAQRFTDYEIVVVDDGSTDGTAEAMQPFADRLRIVRQPNSGPSAARNRGAALARGDYLAFLDSDDQWLPWTLQQHAALIAAHARPTWIYAKAWADPAAAGTIVEEPTQAKWFDSYDRIASIANLHPTGVALQREAFLRCGGFSESLRMGEDLDLWFRLCDAPGFVLLSAPVAYLREQHAGMLSEDSTLWFSTLIELLERERAGIYGRQREASELHRGVISQYLMHFAVQHRKRGELGKAARLYLEVLRSQAKAGFREPGFAGKRNRFLLSFPIQFLSPSLDSWLRGRARAASGK